ncbi:MAG: hypothetical protein J2P14_07445 [Acidothermales bacterium]|nr:hypothetical protein [Acidothermales bacterium]
MTLPVTTVTTVNTVTTVKAVNGRDKLGIFALVLMLLGGAWLAAAPFIVGYQSRGGHWPEGTRNEFFVGVGIMAVAVTALIVFAANALAEISHRPAHVRHVDAGDAGYVD